MSEDKSGINIEKPVIYVNHSELSREGDSIYKSICPVCEDGILLVARDSKTFQIMANDICILCGQHFIYKDVFDPIATRADVKQDIQWISVRERLPERCQKVFAYDGKHYPNLQVFIDKDSFNEFVYWAEINLPEK